MRHPRRPSSVAFPRQPAKTKPLKRWLPWQYSQLANNLRLKESFVHYFGCFSTAQILTGSKSLIGCALIGAGTLLMVL